MGEPPAVTRRPAYAVAPGRRAGAPKGQFLPGTSQAQGPCGPGNSGGRRCPTEGEGTRHRRAPDERSQRSSAGSLMSDSSTSDATTLGARPFVDRHIGPDESAIAEMLKVIGFDSLDSLMDAAVPGRIRAGDSLDLPVPATEARAGAELRALAEQNNPATAMIGLGYHGTVTPGVIRRNVLEDPSWYTAYTPYQPEI